MCCVVLCYVLLYVLCCDAAVTAVSPAAPPAPLQDNVVMEPPQPGDMTGEWKSVMLALFGSKFQCVGGTALL